jgi:hypothetical protein
MLISLLKIIFSTIFLQLYLLNELFISLLTYLLEKDNLLAPW